MVVTSSLLLLENRRLRHARSAPRREHVQHDDLAPEAGQPLRLRFEPRTGSAVLAFGRHREIAARDRRVDRRVRALVATPNASRASSAAAATTTPGITNRRMLGE